MEHTYGCEINHDQRITLQNDRKSQRRGRKYGVLRTARRNLEPVVAAVTQATQPKQCEE